ncbi:hypothetical protein CBS101457_005835 [Exobasidium rhododendri]|nr:hypothetical protein CBS101457_005835 [Exobasidium rhododendri]
MPLALQGCAIKMLRRSLVTSSRSSLGLRDSSAESLRALAAYPIFNLNDESGRHLGPRPGDEAILTLSGGVDSSVASYLAMQQGGLIPYKTIFMRNWNSLEESTEFEPGSGGSQGCQWQRDWEKVNKMARWLGVEAELMDLSTSYWNSVFSPALDDWSHGRTPNPDVVCNREIKFGELLRRVDHSDTTEESTSYGRRRLRRWLVTGHYAGIEYYFPASQEGPLHGRLLRAKDQTKDQSYFLSAVSSKELGRTHFPLSHLSKVEARHLARSLGFPTAESEESMGLCFVGERKGSAKRNGEDTLKACSKERGFAGFLNDYIESRSGDIITPEGIVVGKHTGLHTLTIGQGARIGGAKEKYFVAAKYPTTNQVVVVPGSDHPWLQCHNLSMDTFTFISKEEDDGNILETGDILAQIRHRQVAVPCKAQLKGSTLQVSFTPTISSVAEGQVCALYKGQRCLGSGIITNVDRGSSTHD